MTNLLALALALAFTSVATYTDLRRGEIPNWLSASAFATGVVASAGAAMAGGGDVRAVALAVALALLGAVACGVLPLVLWLKGVMGGGDLKLFVALGALCHTRAAIDIECLSFVTGTGLAFVVLAWRGTLFATLRRCAVLLLQLCRLAKRPAVPHTEHTWFRFAPAILLATLWEAWSRW